MNPLVLIILLPLLEIALFAQVGQWIGALPTVGLVVLAAVVGSLLLRSQGLVVMRRAQEASARGELPVGAVFHGFCIALAGILLIIPGFLTDIVAILLIIPAVRDALGRWLLGRMAAAGGGPRIWMNGRPVDPRHPQRPGPDHGRAGPAGPGVIDADYREVDSDEPSHGDGDRGMPRLGESRWAPPDAGRDGGDGRR